MPACIRVHDIKEMVIGASVPSPIFTRYVHHCGAANCRSKHALTFQSCLKQKAYASSPQAEQRMGLRGRGVGAPRVGDISVAPGVHLVQQCQGAAFVAVAPHGRRLQLQQHHTWRWRSRTQHQILRMDATVFTTCSHSHRAWASHGSGPPQQGRASSYAVKTWPVSMSGMHGHTHPQPFQNPAIPACHADPDGPNLYTFRHQAAACPPPHRPHAVQAQCRPVVHLHRNQMCSGLHLQH